MIQVQIGQCGNQIGSNYWKKITDEHKINLNGNFTGNAKEQEVFLANSKLIFNNPSDNKYVPRAILIDSECSVLDEIRKNEFSKLFKETNILNEKRGTGGLWAAGHNGLKTEFTNLIMESIRKEAEANDVLMFQIVNSIGGGTGSGLGSLLIEKLRSQYPKKEINSFNVVPSPIQNGTVLEYYNSALSMKSLIQNCDGCYFFDNQSLRKTCSKILKLKTVNLNDTNDLITRTMLAISSSNRITNSKIKIDMFNLSKKLSCSSRLHFFVPYLNFSYETRLNQFYQDLKSPNPFLSINNEDPNIFSSASYLNGNFTDDLNQNEFSQSLKWKNTNKLFSICNPKEAQTSMISVINSKGIKEFFERLKKNAQQMYFKRAYVQWYISEQMEETELVEAFEEISNLSNEYEKGINDKINPQKNSQQIENNQNEIKQNETKQNKTNSKIQESRIEQKSEEINSSDQNHEPKTEGSNSSQCCVIN